MACSSSCGSCSSSKGSTDYYQIQIMGKVFSGVDKNLFKPLKWTYLTETVEESPQFQQTSGSWVITPQAFKSRHVYIGFMRANRKSNQERNSFIFDSCDLRSCQLEFGNRRYPDTQYDNSEIARIYNDILGSQSSAFNRSNQLTQIF